MALGVNWLSRRIRIFPRGGTSADLGLWCSRDTGSIIHVRSFTLVLKMSFVLESNAALSLTVTLPLWSPSHIELGAVGYLRKPKGQFVTLFNAMQPHQTFGSKISIIPSLGGYGPIRTGQKFDSKLTVTQRGRDLISGLLTFGSTDDGTYS